MNFFLPLRFPYIVHFLSPMCLLSMALLVSFDANLDTVTLIIVKFVIIGEFCKMQ